MTWLKAAAIGAVFMVAVAVGGAAARIGALMGTPPAIGVLGFIAALVLLGWVAAAKSRQWLENPYW